MQLKLETVLGTNQNDGGDLPCSADAKCGVENPPEARFCAQCATSLTGDQVGQPSKRNIPRNARSFSRNSGESLPSENLFANDSAEVYPMTQRWLRREAGSLSTTRTATVGNPKWRRGRVRPDIYRMTRVSLPTRRAERARRTGWRRAARQACGRCRGGRRTR